MKIYCPQIDSITECDCDDKCDVYKIGLKSKISEYLKSVKIKESLKIIIHEIDYEIQKIIDGEP